MPDEIARTDHGIVLVDGPDVLIDYLPEPGSGLVAKSLSGGRIYKAEDGKRIVVFRDRLPGPPAAAAAKVFDIGEPSTLPGLAELAGLVDREVRNAKRRASALARKRRRRD